MLRRARLTSADKTSPKGRTETLTSEVADALDEARPRAAGKVDELLRSRKPGDGAGDIDSGVADGDALGDPSADCLIVFHEDAAGDVCTDEAKRCLKSWSDP